MNKILLVLALAGATSVIGAQPVAAAEKLAPSTSAIVKNVEARTISGASFVDVQYGRGREGPQAILFSNPDFHGERWVIEGDYMPDLANTGFNDRAQSLRVNRGYWIFCSDAQFRGQCRTFGPGDYPRLGWALDNKVSSGRRIHDRYPYGGPPNWGGDRRY